MTNHELMTALGDMQRALREAFGYAPPIDVDYIDYPHPKAEWCEQCQCYHGPDDHFEEKYPVDSETQRSNP